MYNKIEPYQPNESYPNPLDQAAKLTPTEKKTTNLSLSKIGKEVASQEMPTPSIKEKAPGNKRDVSSFFTSGTGALSNAFSKVFPGAPKIQADPLFLKKHTSNLTEETASMSTTSEIISEIDQTESEKIDPSSFLQNLNTDILSLKDNRIPFKEGSSIESALLNEKNQSNLHTLQELSSLNSKISKFKQTIRNEIFPIETAAAKVQKSIGKVSYTPSQKENEITNLINQLQFSLSMKDKTHKLQDRDSLLKEATKSNDSDKITFKYVVKKEIEKLNKTENSAYKTVRLNFLEAKQIFLEAKIAKTDKVIASLTKQIEAEKSIFTSLGVTDSTELFDESWDQLTSTLRNLSAPQKTEIVKNLDSSIHDYYKVIKPIKDLLYTDNNLPTSLNQEEFHFLINFIKDSAKKLEL